MKRWSVIAASALCRIRVRLIYGLSLSPETGGRAIASEARPGLSRHGHITNYLQTKRITAAGSINRDAPARCDRAQ
jgi:hypothetical protein